MMGSDPDGKVSDAILALSSVAEDIRTMRVRGAGRIARAASKALSDLARDHRTASRDALLEELRTGAHILIGTRPTAVSLRNAILMTLSGVSSAPDLGSLRELVMERSSRFVTLSLSAVERISANGLPLMRDGSLVMTHCNSDAALTLIEKAHSLGKVQGVVATESRPWRQGHMTVRRLASKGIPVTMIVDPAVNIMMREVGAVIVGADTIAADGSLINKVGTSLLALAARDAGVPFIVCAETYKVSVWAKTGQDVVIEDRGPSEVADPLKPSDLPGVMFRNPVFDLTPPSDITAIVTEEGVISPAEMASLVERVREAVAPEGPGTTEGENWLDEADIEERR